MIYVSSACSKQKKIGAAIRELAVHGFQNIELSGGTEYYEDYEADIFNLKEKFSLNYLIHNYFPPPEDDFVLNLSSLNDSIYEKSISHLRKSIRLADQLGAKKYGLHAGFYVDIGIKEIGKAITLTMPKDIDASYERFCRGFNEINEESKEVEIYIENNVYSRTNFKIYGYQIPFMLVSALDYEELKKHISVNLLLDIAHLYVSSQTLNLDFESQFDLMIIETDYVHLSDNDGSHDQNRGFGSGGKLLDKIEKRHLSNKTITLEVYTGIANLRTSFDCLAAIIHD
jgi:sugar phosphate isomerase/epimerase